VVNLNRYIVLFAIDHVAQQVPEIARSSPPYFFRDTFPKYPENARSLLSIALVNERSISPRDVTTALFFEKIAPRDEKRARRKNNGKTVYRDFFTPMKLKLNNLSVKTLMYCYYNRQLDMQ